MIDSNFLLTQVLPALNTGLVTTIALVVPSAVFGFVGGIFIGTLRVFAIAPIKKMGDAFVALFRGVPLLLQLYFLYYALPKWGIMLSAKGAAITGFTLCSAAYHSEYIRGALLSIKQGQTRAALAVGMTHFQLIRYVVIPQAMRRALPGCGNEFIYLIKYSSLAYTLTCIELTGQARELTLRTFTYIDVYLVAGLYYLVLTTVATYLLAAIEKKTAIPGFGPSN